MEYLLYLAFIFVGIIAGFAAGLLGISGGIVIVPSLVFLFHFMDIAQDMIVHTAIGTSLASMILTGAASTYAHHRKKAVMWEKISYLIPGLILGCFLGSLIAHYISGIYLEMFFGVFACIYGALMIFKKQHKKISFQNEKRSTFTWFGLGIGTIASLLGIGGGVITAPLLIRLKYPQKNAVATSAATGLIVTFVATIAYLFFGINQKVTALQWGYIYFPAFAIIGVTALICAPFGVQVAHKLKEGKIKKIFGGVLIGIGILMILW